MVNEDYRIEKDSMGELEVPAEAMYGAQTQRAVNNFSISGLHVPREFIRALGLIKAACASVNRDLGSLNSEIADAIYDAALVVAEGECDDQFPVDVFQTGSGTSSNMNSNEVIAHLASSRIEKSVHPNDHVNMGQSSNDVIPTAIHVSACLGIDANLLPALRHLKATIETTARRLETVVKIGRTHLMDAMPVRFDQELSAWSTQIDNAHQRIQSSLPRLRQLAQGGTAVGTGINAHPAFAEQVVQKLSELTGLEFETNPNKFEALSCQDSAVEMSGQLKTLAVSLMKIANDLRWMNSGPLAGLAEIQLAALQPGSSIMPGKVNPVIPEAVTMVCAQVMGNDHTIAIAGQAGNFQLNVMLPVISYNLLQSIGLLSNASMALADKTIAGIVVNREKILEELERNPILVTALNSVLGYEKGAAIAKRAYAEGRSVIDVAREMTDLSEQELRELLDPMKLSQGGIQSTS